MDLLSLIGQDTKLRKASLAWGGTYWGACPWCGGKDRFHVFPTPPASKSDYPFYWCRGCGESGTIVTYLCKRHGKTKEEALSMIGVGTMTPGTHVVKTEKVEAPESCTVPGTAWQAHARQFVEESRHRLWNTVEGVGALAWLRKRGLRDETIRWAHLGFNPQEVQVPAGVWGLPDDADRPTVWVPRGIVIPVKVGEQIWQVQVRRATLPGDSRKYVYIRSDGGNSVLYLSDTVKHHQPAIIVEGVLDGLSVWQEARDLVAVTAAGTTTGARRIEWIAKLALASQVLVGFDADAAGDKGSEYWLSALKRSRRLRPWFDDPNGMLQQGSNLRDWVQGGLSGEETCDDVRVDSVRGLCLERQWDLALEEAREIEDNGRRVYICRFVEGRMKHLDAA